MKLYDFLNAPGAPSPAEVAAGIGLHTDGAVRQWTKDPNRKPAPDLAPAVEAYTQGKVRRWDMYSELWWKIWPELIGTEGAPELPPNARVLVFKPE